MRQKALSFLAFILLTSAASNAAAPQGKSASPKTKAPVTKQAATPVANEKVSDEKVLRDTWYTITAEGNTPYGYYNERLELKKGRLFLQSHVWKQDEGFINEEQIGAFAEDSSELTPLFYNFHATYRSTELLIDGTMGEKNLLSVRIQRNGAQQPIVKRTVPKAAFFSQFFPVWIARKLPELTGGKSLAFTTIMEDDHEGGFSPALGRIKMEKPDQYAKDTHTHKLNVTYRDVESIWWVEDSGEAVQIRMPTMKTLVQRVTKSEALDFLKKASE